MASWRDDASETAQRDVDELVAAALDWAQEQLPAGSLAPVALTVDLDGVMALTAVGWDDADEPPTASVLLHELRGGLRASRQAFRAVAVVTDAALPDGTDVVQVELEHVEGAVLVVMLPYGRGAEGLTFGELRGAPGRRTTWAQ